MEMETSEALITNGHLRAQAVHVGSAIRIPKVLALLASEITMKT
jgi:hypothetical protein